MIRSTQFGVYEGMRVLYANAAIVTTTFLISVVTTTFLQAVLENLQSYFGVYKQSDRIMGNQ